MLSVVIIHLTLRNTLGMNHGLVILRAATYCHGDIAHICLELSTAQGLNQHCHLFNNHCQIPENITYSSS